MKPQSRPAAILRSLYLSYGLPQVRPESSRKMFTAGQHATHSSLTLLERIAGFYVHTLVCLISFCPSFFSLSASHLVSAMCRSILFSLWFPRKAEVLPLCLVNMFSLYWIVANIALFLCSIHVLEAYTHQLMLRISGCLQVDSDVMSWANCLWRYE